MRKKKLNVGTKVAIVVVVVIVLVACVGAVYLVTRPAGEAPGRPMLVSSGNGTFTNDNTPTFVWIKGENVDSYRLLVDNDPDFSSPEENRLLGAFDNTYTIADENALPNENYSWKVIAINAVGENESDVWTFVVVAPGEAGKSGYLEMPLQEIKNALAAREGASTENVEIQFCELASEADNNHFAAGAIVGGSKSIVLMFDNSTGQISVENEYTASTADELSAISITERELSKWTGNKIVAGWFQSVAGGYTFTYYDGYSTRFQCWLFGFGIVYLDNRSVVLYSHFSH